MSMTGGANGRLSWLELGKLSYPKSSSTLPIRIAPPVRRFNGAEYCGFRSMSPSIPR